MQAASPAVNGPTDARQRLDHLLDRRSSSAPLPPTSSAHSYKLAEGTSFTAEDLAQHRRVAVIGQEVLDELFGGSSAVGQTMKVNGSNYEVIGVLDKKGTNGTTNEDSVVIAPITTVQDTLTGVGAIDSITVQAKSESDLNAPSRGLLDHRGTPQDHQHLQPGFSILNQGSLLKPPAKPAASSRPCSARSPRSPCSSAGSA